MLLDICIAFSSNNNRKYVKNAYIFDMIIFIVMKTDNFSENKVSYKIFLLIYSNPYVS